MAGRPGTAADPREQRRREVEAERRRAEMAGKTSGVPSTGDPSGKAIDPHTGTGLRDFPVSPVDARPMYAEENYDAELARQRAGLIATQGQQGQARHGQMVAGDYYRAMLERRGPSVAEQQLRMGGEQNIQNQMALAAQARGGNMAAASRQAAGIGAGQGMLLNQQAGMQRAAEQQAAMQGYAGLQSTMAQQALQQRLGLEGIQQGTFGQQLNSDQQTAGRYTNYLLGQGSLNLAQNQQDWQKTKDLIALGAGGVSTLLGGMYGGFSDKRLKEEIDDNPEQVRATLLGTKPHSYRYKKGYGPSGRVAGIMAQDLEKTPLGKSIVVDTPHGKAVHTHGLASLAIAGTSDHEKRLARIESLLDGV